MQNQTHLAQLDLNSLRQQQQQQRPEHQAMREQREQQYQNYATDLMESQNCPNDAQQQLPQGDQFGEHYHYHHCQNQLAQDQYQCQQQLQLQQPHSRIKPSGHYLGAQQDLHFRPTNQNLIHKHHHHHHHHHHHLTRQQQQQLNTGSSGSNTNSNSISHSTMNEASRFKQMVNYAAQKSVMQQQQDNFSQYQSIELVEQHSGHHLTHHQQQHQTVDGQCEGLVDGPLRGGFRSRVLSFSAVAGAVAQSEPQQGQSQQQPSRFATRSTSFSSPGCRSVLDYQQQQQVSPYGLSAADQESEIRNQMISFSSSNNINSSNKLISPSSPMSPQSQASSGIATSTSSSFLSQSMSPSEALNFGINLEQYISKRNERERSRVRNVNDAFDNLKNSLPLELEKLTKRMSKVEILRSAINYIRNLEEVLGGADLEAVTGGSSDGQSDQSRAKDPHISVRKFHDGGFQDKDWNNSRAKSNSNGAQQFKDVKSNMDFDKTKHHSKYDYVRGNSWKRQEDHAGHSLETAAQPEADRATGKGGSAAPNSATDKSAREKKSVQQFQKLQTLAPNKLHQLLQAHSD